MDNTDADARQSRWEVWARRLGAFAVAAVAAYASYQHQRGFALTGGADVTTARLWPLSVDGLLVLSTANLLRDDRRTAGRARYVLRVSFAAGIIVSLAASRALVSAACVWKWPESARHNRTYRTACWPRPAQTVAHSPFSPCPASSAVRRRKPLTHGIRGWSHVGRGC